MSNDDLSDTTASSTSLIYHQGESLFGGVAVECLDNGWTLIPQERGERRRSAIIDGRSLKWGEYIAKAPTRKEVEHWARQVPSANAAILLGAPSGNTFCLDIDVLDERFVLEIMWLADEVFGKTKFTRVGMAPKIAMFYRVASEADLPANRSYRFEGDDAMLEIQARGKLVTAYGYHHKTEKYFGWGAEGQPAVDHVESVLLVTPAQIQEFIERVQLLRPFSSQRGSGSIEFIEGDGSLEVSAEGWTIPRRGAGVVDPATGLVTDGREEYLRRLCWDLVRLNPERASASPATAVEVAYGHAMRTVDRSRALDLRAMVLDKIKRAVAMLRAGEIKSLPTVREDADGKRSAPRRGVMTATTDPDLWHLPAPDKRRVIEFSGRTAPDPAKAAARALIPNRDDIEIDVEGKIIGAFEQFFDGVYDGDFDTLKPVHVLKAPTGAGKTTKAIRYIAEDPRTYQQFKRPDGEQLGPILFLLPTYANIDEVRQRADELQLDAGLDDAELAAQAKEMGLVAEDDIAAAIDDAKAAAGQRLETMVYMGKIAAGCQLADKVKALMDAGISSSGLCHARVKRDGVDEDEYCPHYETCPAIAQKLRIAASHVVFLPHAFLSLSIPSELSNARAIIADERIFPLAVHTTRMKLSTLELARDLPPLTKREREAVIAGIGNREEQQRAIESRKHDLVQDRGTAGEIVISALRDGHDPAAVLADWRQGKLAGSDLVASALRVTGGASSRNVVIHPSMSQTAFEEIVTRPTGTEIALEARFWKIVQERLQGLADETARQSREQRIQRIVDKQGETPVEYVRLSWRSDMNWSAAPTLLLDASADPKITAKVFSQRGVVLHDIDAPLSLKAIMIVDSSRSTTSLKPEAGIKSAAAQQQARTVERVRQVETALSARHADGRLMVGMAKSVREARGEFAPMPNVDTLHFGAERGLNFAENHRAALAVGRMELPVWMMDGYAAALGYEDADELVLLDPRGDGCDADGNALKAPIGDLVIPMRDGSDVTIEAAMAPAGTWQRVVQVQFREESLRQFAGRLRPVYRADAPILYLMGRVLPEGIIVDDIVTTADLVPSYQSLLEASRHMNGILDPEIAVHMRPDLATVESYRRMMSSLPEQLRAAYVAVRYTLDGKVHHAGVPAWIEDPVAALQDYLELACLNATDVRIARAPLRPWHAPAAARPLDAVEIELGDLHQRVNSEISALQRAMWWLLDRHRLDRTQLPFVLGRARYPVGTDKSGRLIELGLGAIAMLTRPRPESEPAAGVTDDEIPLAVNG